ncbi:hypothetical protein ACO2Q0_10655 [Phenylobacterium sp. VNQ135]|uniref:hypothetical protein n=1 Tax=Phenylobacterium sp. VNQ135 TaxID=3400922 RepID=UPI003C06BD10
MTPMALAAALSLLAPAAALGQVSPDAARVLAQARSASGGAAWDRLTGSWERGTHGPVRYETALDFRRLAFRFENTVAGQVRVHAFDGEQVWDAAPGQAPKVSRDPEAVREAITTAYVSNNGHFFPQRFPSRAVLRIGVDPAFDVVEIEPAGGRAFELWFDRKTALPRGSSTAAPSRSRWSSPTIGRSAR